MATINPDVFKKFKNATRLPARQEADGHEHEVEVREDEEQSVKFQEIIDLLVAAGYFRARIKDLSPFDKVVGGMSWCIESCNVDLDIDLLFQENSTIGQKIALTEKIVAVLPKIKCPHVIEPHQIQGLDFIHIFPVVQWLVKRSMENRQEMSVYVRSYAVNQFHKQFHIASKNNEQQKILQNLNTVSEIYRPHRYFKRKNAPPPDVNSRVQITLLEYGHKGGETHSAANNSECEETIVKNEQMDQKQIQQLLSNLTVTQEEPVDYEDLNEEERSNLLKHYASLHNELQDGGIKSQEINYVQSVENQLKILCERCDKLEAQKLLKEDNLKQSYAVLQDIRLKKQETDTILKELEKVESNNTKALLEAEELVKLNDNLKAQESQFRENCKKELARLQNLISETKHAKANTPPTDTDSDIIKQITDETETVRILRLQVAKKNRQISALQRQLDDVPNRAELAQYQRRFLELYNQVAAKHKETKQYYTLYNTLEDTKMYMQKELSLLNSISENYPEAMQSSAGKEEFLKEFQKIVDSVVHSKLRVEQKLTQELQKLDQLSHTLHNLIEHQRKYVVAVRQLTIECRRHESLVVQTQSRPRKL